MQEILIRLAAMWIALMLTYLLGDVLRIFAGDFKPGEIRRRPSDPGDVDWRSPRSCSFRS